MRQEKKDCDISDDFTFLHSPVITFAWFQAEKHLEQTPNRTNRLQPGSSETP